MYIAHVNEKTGALQSIKEHSFDTAEKSELFAILMLKNLVYNIGLYHDIGKYQQSFQKRIKGEKLSVEHSGCGAQVCMKMWSESFIGQIMAYCILGHHNSLPDGGALNDSEDI